VVADFAKTDKLDFSAMDAASSTPANDAFTFIGTGGFSGQEGQLRYEIDTAASRTYVQGDLNGDGAADFQLTLLGVQQLTLSDLLL
jgi:hypothetical protein